MRISKYLWIGIWAVLCICSGQVQAQSCHFNLKFKLANGETTCLTSQKFANEIPRKQLYSIERLAKTANNYYLAKSVDERCQSWGFVDVASMVQQISDKISPPRTAFDNAKKSALSECESSGCKCQILIDDGTVNSAHPEYARIFDKGAPGQTTQIAAGPEKENKTNENTAFGQSAQTTKPGVLGLLNSLGQTIQLSTEPKVSSVADEQRIAAEVKARLDALLAAESKEREIQRLVAEARERELQRLATETKAREEQRLAAEARAREEQRIATEARQREAQRLAAEAKAREELRLAAEVKAREEQRLRAAELDAERKRRELAEEKLRVAQIEERARDQERLRVAELDAERRRREELEEKLRIAQLPRPIMPPQQTLNAHALIIGNAAYPGSGRLENPVNDSRAISAKLRSFGFKVTEVEDANRAKLVTALGQFSRSAASADLSILFYSGHGVQLLGTNYILPTDIDQADLAQATIQGISLDSVIGQFLPGKTKLVFLDACRDNPLYQFAANKSVIKGLAPISVAEGTLIAYATKDGQVASDGGKGMKNSPFTFALLEHLADPDDINIVLRRVREKVKRATGGKQVPWEYGSLTGDALILSAIKQVESKK